MGLNEDSLLKINDVVEAEKKLFIMKSLSDKLEGQYENSRYISKSVSECDFVVKKPEEIVCRLKKVPEKPILNDSENKLLVMSKYLMSAAAACAVVFALLFFIVMIMTGFFKKGIMETGFWGAFYWLSLILGVVSAIISYSLKVYAKVRYKEAVESWENIRRRIELYNRDEQKNAAERINNTRIKYENDKALQSKMIQHKILNEKAKALVFDLEKAKINKNIISLEAFVSDAYAHMSIPVEYRRIDIAMFFAEYIENNSEKNLLDAEKTYAELKKNNLVPIFLSDALENQDTYMSNMQSFYRFISSTEQILTEIMADNILLAENIAAKSLNEDEASIKSNILAMEFQRAYDESEMAMFAKNNKFKL